jgi:hypothetical protein
MKRKFLTAFAALFLLFCGEVHAHIRMGIVNDTVCLGEQEFSHRLQIAGERLGWEVFLDEMLGRGLENVRDLDLVISLVAHNEYSHPGCPTYFVIFNPFNYFDQDGQVKSCFSFYDGFLHTIKRPQSLENAMELLGKKCMFLPFFPFVQSIDYQRSNLVSLVTILPASSNRLTDSKFKELYYMLDNSGFTRLYGRRKSNTLYSNSYKGKIPFDGISVINVFQKYGIVLVVHSDMHNETGIPSSRIFEGAASSSVIISDLNPFVQNHFGDSVFYVDTSQSAKAIFKDIYLIMKKIRSNPEKALEMAKRSYQIYHDNFLLEDQLLRLEAMHQATWQK